MFLLSEIHCTEFYFSTILAAPTIWILIICAQERFFSCFDIRILLAKSLLNDSHIVRVIHKALNPDQNSNLKKHAKAIQ